MSDEFIQAEVAEADSIIEVVLVDAALINEVRSIDVVGEDRVLIVCDPEGLATRVLVEVVTFVVVNGAVDGTRDVLVDTVKLLRVRVDEAVSVLVLVRS